MIHVNKEDRKLMATLFEGLEDSMVIAYLQGFMGDGYVDRLPNPQVGLIVSAEYCFFGGDPSLPAAKELAEHLFDTTPLDQMIAIYVEKQSGWFDLLMLMDQNRPVSLPRFGIVQRDYEFNMEKLKAIAADIPDGLELVAFDEELYRQAMSEHWSMAFCEAFASPEEYLAQGFGFAVTDNGKLVAGASTMTVYDGGTETQVSTREEYRGRGLALACSAAFIMECDRRGMRPCWDAANEASLHMAQKLGYEYRGLYMTVELNRPAEKQRLAARCNKEVHFE
jgi:GNAT superfamily N-acetyltransferase